jgi:hypothetical protein
MKPASAVVLLIIVLAATTSGCFGSDRKITATVAPATPQPTATPVPTATPRPTTVALQPKVTIVGDTTSISGTMAGVARDFRLKQGVYIVTWSGSGSQLSLSLADLNGNTVSDLSNGRTSGSRLLAVDGSSFYAGNYSLMATSDGDWSVTIKRPDTSSAGSLPLTMSGGESEGAVSAPFKANKGYIKIGYTFTRTPYDAGYVYIYAALTGESFYVRPMTSGSQLGQSMADVPANGVYIAQARMPPGSSYGDITISQ